MVGFFFHLEAYSTTSVPGRRANVAVFLGPKSGGAKVVFHLIYKDSNILLSSIQKRC